MDSVHTHVQRAATIETMHTLARGGLRSEKDPSQCLYGSRMRLPEASSERDFEDKIDAMPAWAKALTEHKIFDR